MSFLLKTHVESGCDVCIPCVACHRLDCEISCCGLSAILLFTSSPCVPPVCKSWAWPAAKHGFLKCLRLWAQYLFDARNRAGSRGGIDESMPTRVERKRFMFWTLVSRTRTLMQRCLFGKRIKAIMLFLTLMSCVFFGWDVVVPSLHILLRM